MLKRLARLAKWVGLGLLLLLVVVVGGWVYWGYSPIPAEPELAAELQKRALIWGERERSYFEYIPPGLPDGAPLIVVLHGSVMNGGMMRIASGYRFDELADRKHFAVVYPSGYRGHWNDCRTKANFSAKREQVDDVGFLSALVDRMVEQHHIDPARVYLVGYSNGGHMAFRLGIEAQPKFAGMATAAASLPVQEDSSCNPDSPTPPLLQVNGTADMWNPYEGGEVGLPGVVRRGRVHGALASAQTFAVRNGAVPDCIAENLPELVPDDDTRVTRHNCLRDGKPYVVLYSIEGGGHVFPQPVYRFPRMYGRTSQEFNLPDAAVEFFGL